jgi:hypothetical protein
MAADLNGDGEVDFEEFMKHFPNVLNLIQYSKAMQAKYLEVMAEENTRNKYLNETKPDES